MQLAPLFIGKILVTETSEGLTSGKIVEVEAYTGINDPASHTYKGRRTPRTEVIYQEGGRVYVYRIHGIHICLNIVVNRKDIPECVFIRALQPIEGLEIMKKRRRTEDIKKLTSGPARLTQALGIDMSFYGESLIGDRIYICEGERVPSEKIGRSPRINIDYAGEARNLPLRFYIKNNPFLRINTLLTKSSKSFCPKYFKVGDTHAIYRNKI